jgi:hypothetical protein
MDVHEAQRDINTIRAVAAGLSRKRDAVYVLLTQIYLVGHKWAKSGQAKVLRDAVIILEELRVDRRTRRNLFRFLIEVGWPALDRKLRSRYANALKYATSKNCPIAKLTTFLKSRGGIEKCANRYVAERKVSTRSEH